MILKRRWTFSVEDFLVVLVDDGCHVFCAAVTNFQVVFIEDAVNSVGFWKMLTY